MHYIIHTQKYTYTYLVCLCVYAYQCGLGQKFVQDCDLVKPIIKSVILML